jgi:uncharacterized protein
MAGGARVIEATPSGRVRAFGYFVIAGVYFFFAQTVATHAANGLASGEWYDLVERLILLFLLLIGYTAMGRAFQRQHKPIEAMGLIFRPGWGREFAVGASLGWGMLIASILPLVLIGGLIVTVWTGPRQFFVLAVDVLVLAVASLAEEVVFRGYPFQRLIEVMGPFLATLVLSTLFGVAHALNPDSSRRSIMIAIFAGWLLSVAYLRTRALWLSWGWHFAWNASMGLLFGLPVSGITRFSPVIQSNTIGPLWITGGEYGPEASLVTVVVMLIGIIVLFKITRNYAYRYAQPAVFAASSPINLPATFPGTFPEAFPDAFPDRFPDKLDDAGTALGPSHAAPVAPVAPPEPAHGEQRPDVSDSGVPNRGEDSGVEDSGMKETGDHGVENRAVENHAVENLGAENPGDESSKPSPHSLRGGEPSSNGRPASQEENLPIPPDSRSAG